jgi:hypothetical protein
MPHEAGPRGGRLRDPREAVAQLRQQLSLHWPGRVYQGDRPGLSVLSISPELTVWCDGRDFFWREVEGRPVRHPAADPVTAAVRLSHRIQQLTEPPPPPSPAAEEEDDAGPEDTTQ